MVNLSHPFKFSGTKGKETFIAKRFLPRGGAIKEGVKVVELNSTYRWQSVDGTEFSIGLVIAVHDHMEKLSKLTPVEGR